MSNMSGDNSQSQQHQDSIADLERRIAALQAAEFQPLREPYRVPTQSHSRQFLDRSGIPLYRVDERNGDSRSTVSADSLSGTSSSVPTSATTFTHEFAARRASAAQHTPASTTGYRAPSSEKDADSTSGGRTLFERYNETVQAPGKSLIGNGLKKDDYAIKDVDDYAEPFINFMTENPTIWHAIAYWENKLEKAGYKRLSERDSWSDELEAGGKYYVTRNGTSLVAFAVGGKYKSGNGIAMAAAHSDSLTARLKPISTKRNKAGYIQLGVAPYAGGLNETWWDRDLGIGGRVLVKDEETGAISQKLVKLGWPIARIPTLAPHFGVGMTGAQNKETQLVPIIGLDNSDIGATTTSNEEAPIHTLGSESAFIATQPPRLVSLIANELGIKSHSSILNWELELFDTQPACLGGLNKEFIFAGRIDDKVCSWSTIEALLTSTSSPSFSDSTTISLAALFDDEEIGSLLRQGARGNFLPGTIERIVESFTPKATFSPNVLSQTYANSFLVSFDVTHAANPNFLEKYLDSHAPRLNVGLSIEADSNGHTTTDAVSTAIMQRLAEKYGEKLQVFMIRNDSRSGGTVGPMLSAAMGVRAIDVGVPQLSMHSIRATIGRKDPGLAARMLTGVYEGWGEVDNEFREGNGW
ncbi:vacuolar aminopeptidase 1, variant 2 [Clarireedia jacksonii]